MALTGDGSLTAVVLPPPEAATAILAAWRGGRAVLPLDPRAPAPERERALAATRPTHLLDSTGRRPLPGGHEVAPQVAAVVTTSGTTAEPKGVELTWDGLRASATAVVERLSVTAADRWLGCLPLHGVGGLGLVARSLVAGVAVVPVPRFDPAVLGGADATVVSLVPTMLGRALDAGVDLARFRVLLLGGAPLEPRLRQRAEAAGARLVDAYGLSETWGGVVHEGRPLAGAEVRLADDGEVLVRGPMVMRGYRFRPDLTAAALGADGWLRTGDAGSWLPDGRLQVLDRLGDMVITGGVNVSPTEVEAVLATHPAVADVAVVPAPDAEWGQRVVACVVPTDAAAPPTLAELRAFAAGHLSAAKLPRQLVLVETVPRTAGGKPRRRLLATSKTGADG